LYTGLGIDVSPALDKFDREWAIMHDVAKKLAERIFHRMNDRYMFSHHGAHCNN
jgi:hypothetical protein